MSYPPDHPFTRFTITAEDYANALRLHMRRYWATRWGPKLFVIVVFVIAIGAMVMTDFDEAWTSAAIGGIIGAVLLPLLGYLFIVPRRARKVYSQQKTLKQPVEVSWTQEAYIAHTEAAASTVAWTDYYGWSADGKMVMFMQSQNLFQMLPRHALTDEQMNDLTAIIERSGLKRI
ncbi:YcxB family protein [Pelagibacterium sp. H642]|uniref:YcxB family protein n=1 Tax=Pelagibacterium sp. H642 TaxID=1881069 RepID=UPI002814D64E|nr:YcxB family protein [Pelagibacterium sp. H642]WMT89454.1 YcxB family protein [Pelagibacterium sp. H642]